MHGYSDRGRRMSDVLVVRHYRNAMCTCAEREFLRQLVAPLYILFLPVNPHLQLVHSGGRIAGRFH